MYRVADNELNWFSSYPKHRQQMVFFQRDVLQWGTTGIGIRPFIFFLFCLSMVCRMGVFKICMLMMLYFFAATNEEKQHKLKWCVGNLYLWYL